MYRQRGTPKAPDQAWLNDELRAIEGAFAKSKRAPAFITLVDAATVSVNAGMGSDNFRLVLGGNRTLANPTGLTNGQEVWFWVKQDGTGGRTLAYGSKYKFEGAVAPVVTAGANALSILGFKYNSTDDILGVIAVKLDVR